MLLRRTATTTGEFPQYLQTYSFQIPLFPWFQREKNPLSCWKYACCFHLQFRQQPVSQYFTKFYFIHVFTYLPDETLKKNYDRGAGCFGIVNCFESNLFSFKIKWFSISNQNIFRFESTIVLNYVSNRSRENSIFGWKASNPIILE